MLTTFIECPFCAETTQHLCLTVDGEVLLCQECLHQYRPREVVTKTDVRPSAGRHAARDWPVGRVSRTQEGGRDRPPER